MKEKILAISTLGIVFGLFFYYKVVNPADSFSGIQSEIIESDILKNESVLLNDDIDISIKDINAEIDCNLSESETNVLDFSSAFKYYRTCNEPGNNFVWKGNLYSTLLKIENENDLGVSKNLVVHKSIDKKHLKLQDQLIGMDIK